MNNNSDVYMDEVKPDIEAESSRCEKFLYSGAALAALSGAGVLYGVECLRCQLFALWAWAYILVADGLVYRRRGSSVAIPDTGNFLALAAGSVVMMGLLELLNLRFHAWYYANMRGCALLRWAGLALGWAAVLPCLLVTNEILLVAGVWRWASSTHLVLRHRYMDLSLPFGAALIGLALLFPKPLWPLVFAALFVLAEPFNRRLGLPSFLREWEFGLPGKTVRLALSGLICGLLWNFWNSAAGLQWVYTGGFELGPELLGLPLSVYAGFPVLALTLYALHGFVLLGKEKLMLKVIACRPRFGGGRLEYGTVKER